MTFEIQPEEIVKVTQDPVKTFYDSLKSEATKLQYDKRLRKVLCQFLRPILEGDPDIEEQKTQHGGLKKHYKDADFKIRMRQIVELGKKDPEKLEQILTTLIIKLKERTKIPKINPDYIKAQTVRNYFFPLQKLLEMNKVNLSWKLLHTHFPIDDEKDTSRAYNREEIQSILEHCKIDESMIVYMGIASGIRAGAFTLEWKHIMPVYEYEGRYVWEDITESIVKNGKLICGMLRIYADSRFEYFAFITPETLKIIKEYKKYWTFLSQRTPSDNDPFFINRRSPFGELKDAGIRQRLRRTLIKSGYRPPLTEGQRRHEVPIFNGFRRYFNKMIKTSLTKNSTLGSLIYQETMMGHEGLIKLDKNYFKTHATELIAEYIDCIPNLTISDSERQKVTIKKKDAKIDLLEKQKNEIIDSQKDEMARLNHRIEALESKS